MKKKILWISDFIGTGYSSVSIELINGLYENFIDELFDIYCFVLNTLHIKDFVIQYITNLIPGINPEHIILPIKNPIYLQSKNEIIFENEMVGYNYLYEHLSDINPDICFILNDNGILNNFSKLIKKFNSKIKVFGYLPIDSSNIPEHFFDDTEKYVDILLTMNEFSKKTIQKTLYSKPIYVLHHPISSTLFYPKLKSEARNYISKLFNKKTFGLL